MNFMEVVREPLLVRKADSVGRRGARDHNAAARPTGSKRVRLALPAMLIPCPAWPPPPCPLPKAGLGQPT
jgi:hypothetical protein